MLRILPVRRYARPIAIDCLSSEEAWDQMTGHCVVSFNDSRLRMNLPVNALDSARTTFAKTTGPVISRFLLDIAGGQKILRRTYLSGGAHQSLSVKCDEPGGQASIPIEAFGSDVHFPHTDNE